MSSPLVSIVVPTRGDTDTLARLLEGLSGQDAPPDRFEVILVVDGRPDGPDGARRPPSPDPGLRLTVITQERSGPIVARNRGAAAAMGDVLLFLDDDVVPEATVIAAHAALHAREARAIGIGYLPPAVTGSSFWSIALRGWWQSVAERQRSPWHRRHYQDLLAGHCSMRRTLFRELGGFDTTLPCQEDFDLALRAAAAGVKLLAVPGAVARHHDASTLGKVLRRREAEGRAHVVLAHRHPGLAHTLLLGQPVRGRKRHWLWHLAWQQRQAGDLVLAMLLRLLPVYEQVRLRYRWRDVVDLALFYVYWRGVADALGDRRALARLLDGSHQAPADALTIDLAHGVDRAAARVDAQRPRALRITWGDMPIGHIDDEIGAEPLRGEHLRAVLATRMADAYVRAARRAAHLPPALHDVRLRDDEPGPRQDTCPSAPAGDGSVPAGDGGERPSGLGDNPPPVRELEGTPSR